MRRRLWLAVLLLTVVAVVRFAYFWYYADLSFAYSRAYARAHEAYGSWALRAFGDNLDRQLLRNSGRNGVDCGRVYLGSVMGFWGERAKTQKPKEPEAAACALRAFHDRKSFRIRYDIDGFDSASALAFASDKRGRLYEFVFDGDPWGNSWINYYRQRVATLQCPQPAYLGTDRSGLITCWPGKSFAPSIMWPHW